MIESNSDRVKAGDIVLNQGAWRDNLVADDSNVTVLQPFDNDRLSLYLGALGMPGLTLMSGFRVVNPKPEKQSSSRQLQARSVQLSARSRSSWAAASLAWGVTKKQNG